MRLGGCIGERDCPTPQFGLGAGAALNINQHFAIDSSFNLLPGYDNLRSYAYGVAQGGHASEFLVGARAEVRAKRYGFFADAKPGLLSWSEVPTAVTVTPGTGGSYDTESWDYGRRTFFATEFGGGLEYSPSARVHVRVDMGDLLVRYYDGVKSDWAGITSIECSPCRPWANNLQTTAGVYFGVGKPIAWTPPNLDAPPPHRFFDRTNLALLGVSLLGQTADAITTQRFISHGVSEEDPLARPFVKFGWSGQIGLAVINNGAEITGMYGLHRMHQHRIERIVPLAIAAASGVMAYRNQRDR